MRRLPSICAAAAVVLGCAPGEPAGPARAPVPGASLHSLNTDLPSGRALVWLSGERADFEASVRALGGRVARRHPEIGIVTVTRLGPDAARLLAGRADVLSVEPDSLVQWIPSPDRLAQLFTAGADQSGAELFQYQWNMRAIAAQPAWQRTPAGDGRLVCVLDTGVDPDHVELAGRVDLSKSTSFVDGDSSIQDWNAHGTFVASIISSNGIRIASVAPASRLCAVKVLATDGTGSYGDLIAGILFAARERVDVINMSLGAYVNLRKPGVRGFVRALQAAIDYAASKGVVIVAAAGNDTIDLATDARDMLEVPAQLEHVIAVGATAPLDQQDFDQLASYSNYGAARGIALVAPGGDLRAGGSIFDLVLGACSHTEVTLPFPCGPTYVLSAAGTSVAAPHVAGAAAVVASSVGPRAAAAITTCILAGADPVGPTSVYGAGRLNVLNAALCRRGARGLQDHL